MRPWTRWPAPSALCQRWRPLVRSLPAGAAIELILEQSGLLAKAAAARQVREAGKLVYALDCLRAACENRNDARDAVKALEESGEEDESDAPVLEPADATSCAS